MTTFALPFSLPPTPGRDGSPDRQTTVPKFEVLGGFVFRLQVRETVVPVGPV